MAAIHYRFKNVPGEHRINFDGAGLAVSEIKRQIVQQGKVGKGPDFDLLIKNVQTNEGACSLPRCQHAAEMGSFRCITRFAVHNEGRFSFAFLSCFIPCYPLTFTVTE